MIDLWLDDERPTPEGWTCVKHTWDAIALLKRREVNRMSLDHDLGSGEPTGYDLLKWCAEFGKWSKEKPVVHSMNPVGAFAMRAIIDRYFPEAP